MFCTFASLLSPPSVSALHGGARDCKFAPLANSESIYTVDAWLWEAHRENLTDEYIKNFCSDYSPIPDYSAISETIIFSENRNCYLIMALADFSEYIPLVTPGWPVVRLNLASWANIKEDFQNLRLIDLGFDVIDYHTNISALANIGYRLEVLNKIECLRLKSNKFGLLSTKADANKFIDFANEAVPEHKPFISVKVLARIPEK